jgi:hypothetical protein
MMNRLRLVIVGLFLAATFKEVRSDSEEVCQVKTDGNLCLFDGQKILTESAYLDNNVLLLTFDSEILMDSSGYEQTIVTQPNEYAPGLYGRGASAKLDKDTYIEIEDDDEFDLNAYTITFWIFYNGGIVIPSQND